MCCICGTSVAGLPPGVPCVCGGIWLPPGCLLCLDGHAFSGFPHTPHTRAAVSACCSFACLGACSDSVLPHTSGLILPSTCLSLLHVWYCGAKGEAAGVEHATVFGKWCGISVVCMWGSSSSCYRFFPAQPWQSALSRTLPVHTTVGRLWVGWHVHFMWEGSLTHQSLLSYITYTGHTLALY